MTNYDYIVVGSGCSAAMSAQTLVEAGKTVLMLDVGEFNPNYDTAVPDSDFITLRKTDQNQYKYLIGEKAEGIVWGNVGKGAQITPPRKHLFGSVDSLLASKSRSFFPAESLAYGGLGAGWGIGCWQFSKPELDAAGLVATELESAYKVISQRIGVSATKDDAQAYTISTLDNYQPSADMDRNDKHIYAKYLQKKASFKKNGFVMGRAPLALLTMDLGKRKAYKYRDLDFYSDKEHSAWRPWMTINELKKSPNFTYIGQRLVLTFKDSAGIVTVRCLDTKTNKTVSYSCKKLMLTAGPLGDARIVLRSFKSTQKLPLLCNPYSYIPCIQPKFFGKEAESHKLGFAQLSLFIDEDGSNLNTAMASIYSYQSLMLFRVIKEVPLNFKNARAIMQYLVSGIVIMGIHQSDSRSPDKFVQLQKDAGSITGDHLYSSYTPSSDEVALRSTREKKFIKILRKTGTFALKSIDPGNGASIHYAGTLPISDNNEPFTVDRSGLLHGTKNVYVADSSSFQFLPAKGLTFTILAHSHNVTRNLLRNE